MHLHSSFPRVCSLTLLLILVTAGCGPAGREPTGDAGAGTALARTILTSVEGGYQESSVWIGVYAGADLSCQVLLDGPEATPMVQAVFPVSSGGGGIPAGVDRIFLARGMNTQGAVVSEGCVGGITIIPGTDTVVKNPIRLVPVYEAPVIASLEPAFGGTGQIVIIQGENFSPVAEENAVSFEGTAAPVREASGDRLEVNVPAGAVSGRVAVRVGRQEGVGADFTVVEDEVTYAFPYALGATPDGSRMYVSRFTPTGPDPGIVSVLDSDPASPTYHQVLVEEAAASTRYVVEHIRVTPDGRLAFGPAAHETVVIDTDPASRTFHTEIHKLGYPPLEGLLYNPHDVEITPDSRRAYVSYNETGAVGAYDIDREGGNFAGLLARIPFGDDPSLTFPLKMALSPDGKRLFACLYIERTVAVIDTDPMSGNYHQVLGRFDMGQSPQDVVLTPDGRWLCAADTFSDALVVVDALEAGAGVTDLDPVAKLVVCRDPRMLTLSPGGKRIYVAGGDDEVSAVNCSDPDPARWLVEHRLAVPDKNPAGMAIIPDQSRAYLSYPSADRILVARLGQPHPVITGLDPLSGDEGSLVTVDGSGFAETAEDNTVDFAGTPALAEAVTSAGLQVRVPRGARSGALAVTAGERKSNSRHFSVTPFEAGRIPSPRFSNAIAVSPDGSLVFYGTSPIPAGGARIFLLDTDPASPTCHQVLWEGSAGIGMGTGAARFSQDGSRVYFQMDNNPLSVLRLDHANLDASEVVHVGTRGNYAFDFDQERGLAYVTDWHENVLYKVDLHTDVPVGEPLRVGEAGLDSLEWIEMSPAATDRLFVLGHRPGNTRDMLYVVDPVRWEVLHAIPATHDGWTMTPSPDGAFLYLIEYDDDAVLVMDTAAMENGVEGDEIVAQIAAGIKPSRLRHAPDRQRLYVTNTGSSDVTIIDTDPASPTFRQAIQALPSILGAHQLVITPDGSRAYVTSSNAKDGGIALILLHEVP